jgi:N6-L-threonylcarbamoyladenine synthase
MVVLGIETSCDECAAAVVEDGDAIRSNIVATQIPFHARWGGVVPEIASRKHTEWIDATVREALNGAGLTAGDVDAVAATAEPGLLGSLLVGLTFGKAFAWTRGIPFVPVNHLHAHLYAVRLGTGRCADGKDGEKNGRFAGSPPDYPYLGLLVSGGHSMICRVDDFDQITTLGTTLDDAAGEAFDKVGKHYGLPYPAGKYVDEMAKTGDENAFTFPMPNLHKNGRPSDMSFSGLKNAVINQRETFRRRTRSAEGKGAGIAGRHSGPSGGKTRVSGEEGGAEETADVIASFQKAAVKILLRALFRAVDDTGITTVVAGGGVAANSCLRARLAERTDIHAVFPLPELCGDNGAMVAGFAYHKLRGGDSSAITGAAL